MTMSEAVSLESTYSIPDSVYLYTFVVYLTTLLVTWNYSIAYSDGKIGE
jgi:hypothetical protein